MQQNKTMANHHMNESIMEDYRSNKQTVGESPNEKYVDESPPVQAVGALQSVDDASR